MKRALIFGIGGFVGPYLARELHRNDYHVFGSDVIKCNTKDAIECFEADLMDAQETTEIIGRVNPTVIFNLAAISSVGQSWRIPQTTMNVNIIGALNILEAARVCGSAPKIMFIGSSEEYAVSDTPINELFPLNANNPYGISKITQENLAGLYRNHYGMKVYSVRSFNHTGIGQKDTFVIPNWCKQAAAISGSGKAGKMFVGNLNVKRDLSDVRDIVRAYRMIIESDDDQIIFNVGSGTATDLKWLLYYITSLSDQPITVEIDPTLLRPVDTPMICCDHSLITDKLGWKPEYGIRDTVNELFEYYMGRNNKCRN